MEENWKMIFFVFKRKPLVNFDTLFLSWQFIFAFKRR